MNESNLEELIPQLDGLTKTQLMATVKSLETLLEKTKDCISAMAKRPEPPINPTNPLVDNTLFEHQLQPDIDAKLLEETHAYLKTLEYYPSAARSNSPDIHLFGSQKYGFNKQSDGISPTPIQPDSLADRLCSAVNKIRGTNYNSLLASRFKDVNCYLGPHKDDEKCLKPTSPISSLSLGATRSLHISNNVDKHVPVETVILIPGSLFTMEPGFQDLYYHSIAAGDKKKKNKKKNVERGVIYSVTFRELIPTSSEESSVEEAPAPTTTNIDTTPSEETPPTETLDTFVFGSSLLKGLDEKTLSKYSKNFKVFCHPGACVSDIYEDVEKMQSSVEYDTAKVSGVFLLCGGNDLEKLEKEKDSDIKFVFEDVEDLVYLTREVFPNAKIHLISTIPRRSQYISHIRNMHRLNYWLNRFCKRESLRFIDIFSFYVNKLESGVWELNRKLFNGSRLHFSKIGDSVLAKVLIGVSNLPRP